MSIKRTPPEEHRLLEPREPSEAERSLTRRFLTDPARAYHDLLVLYAEMIKRMIRRFFRDWDDVMDVFTSVCERLQANDYAALRRFKQGSPLEPWLSVITSNASRDKARRNRVGGAPPSLLEKLEPFERLVYRAHYLQRAEHDVIAETASARLGTTYSTADVRDAIVRIDTLLGVEKRWSILHLIALRARSVSVDELIDLGLDPVADEEADFEEVTSERAQRKQLTAAFDEMEDEDKLLIQLRFEQNLTAVQIADVMGYDNYKQVYTRLRTVIDRMRRVIEKNAW